MTDEMKFLAALLCAAALTLRILNLGDRFVKAKIENDTSIAADTKRIADALDKHLITPHRRFDLDAGN